MPDAPRSQFEEFVEYALFVCIPIGMLVGFIIGPPVAGLLEVFFLR